jgi:alcohol dehydrogenase (cytochrome c)
MLHAHRKGNIIATNADSGKTLWSFRANGPSKASPMTFTAGGKQFVAIASGPNILCFGLP